MSKWYEGDALAMVKRSSNMISGKKIYLKAVNKKEGTEEYRGVTSAGLKLWGAIDFLTNHCGYNIVYEVSGKKNAINEG